MDPLMQARKQIRRVDYVEGSEARDNEALLGIAWALVAVCEQLDRWNKREERAWAARYGAYSDVIVTDEEGSAGGG